MVYLCIGETIPGSHLSPETFETIVLYGKVVIFPFSLFKEARKAGNCSPCVFPFVLCWKYEGKHTKCYQINLKRGKDNEKEGNEKKWIFNRKHKESCTAFKRMLCGNDEERC